VAESDTEVVLVGDAEPSLGAQLRDTGTWKKRVRCGEDRRVEARLAEVDRGARGGLVGGMIRTGMEMAREEEQTRAACMQPGLRQLRGREGIGGDDSSASQTPAMHLTPRFDLSLSVDYVRSYLHVRQGHGESAMLKEPSRRSDEGRGPKSASVGVGGPKTGALGAGIRGVQSTGERERVVEPKTSGSGEDWRLGGGGWRMWY
jgi:hypothetical protein